MRLIDADMGREKLQEIYNAWNLAMAPAEGREIAYVDKKMRLCELMIKFLDQLPTIPPTPNDPLTLEQLREMDGSRCGYANRTAQMACGGLVDLEYQMIRLHGGGLAIWENNDKSWLAYRRKPEEGRT